MPEVTITLPATSFVSTYVNGEIYVRRADVSAWLTRIAEMLDAANAREDVARSLRALRDQLEESRPG